MTLRDLEYVIGKSYGIKGKLLSYAMLEELASSKNLDELVEKLRPTDYGPYVSNLPRPLKPISIELALRRRLIEVHFDMAMKSKNAAIIQAYYMKYLTSNLKTILKGKALGKSYEELLELVDFRAEELVKRRDIVVKAMAAKDLAEAVKSLSGTKFSDVAYLAFEVYEKEKDLAVFDTAMDKAYFSEVLEGFSKLRFAERKRVRQIVAVDVDGYMVLAIMRSKLWGLTVAEIRRFLLDKAVNISRDVINMMVEAESIPDILHILEEKTPYTSMLPELPTSGVAIIRALEEAFEKLSLERASEAFLRDIFSVSVPLALLRLKELEVRNISIIAAGIAEGLSASRILQRVIKTQ
ncbi:MAG: V-type ATPase subunit [Nitrososphaerota archaeon]